MRTAAIHRPLRTAAQGASMLLLGMLTLASIPIRAAGRPAQQTDSSHSRLEEPVTLEHLLRSAGAAAERGQWAAAEIEYQNVLVREPAHLDAIVKLAGVYEAMGRYDYARGLLQRALILDPRNRMLIEQNVDITKKLSRSLHRDIDSLLAGGAYEPAIPKLSLLLTLEPENPDLHYRKALCHYHVARLDIALPSVETALRLRAEVTYHELRQLILERRQQDQLYALLRQAARGVDPETDEDTLSALTALAGIIELDPDNAWAKREFLRLSEGAGTGPPPVHDDAPPRRGLAEGAARAAGSAAREAARALSEHLELLLSALMIILLFRSPLTRAILKSLPRQAPLSGSLSRFSISEILSLVNSHARTGVLVIKSPSISGRIHFDNGEACHCETKNLHGIEALRTILKRASGGTFYFRETKPAVRRTIETPLSLIIMDLPDRKSMPASEDKPKRTKSKIAELLESK